MNTSSFISRRSTRRQQRGVTLVELMIAMLLGLFLLGGTILIFDKTKKAYRYQNGLAEIQEQGRFAIGFLTQSLRVAGYPGDNSPPGNKIEGTDGQSDTVLVRLRDDIDCRDQATGGIAVNRFRISDSNLECSGDGVTWDVFVENVEDLQVLFGEDTDGDGIANRYLSTTAGPAWANVVTARVSLMVRSSDNATMEPEEYRDLSGNVVTPQDRRLRRPFSSTITLRN